MVEKDLNERIFSKLLEFSKELEGGWRQYFKQFPEEWNPEDLMKHLIEAVSERSYDQGFWGGWESGKTERI